MFLSGRHLYVLFCCQQAVEKMLKALIAARLKEIPPRIHNLVRLAETAALQPGSDRLDFLRELSAYYVQSRYPEEIQEIASHMRREEAQRVLNQTEEAVGWLSSML